MSDMNSPSIHLKRKRSSPSFSSPALPPQKTIKTTSSVTNAHNGSSNVNNNNNNNNNNNSSSSSSSGSTGNALQINYLARHSSKDLPLLNKNDTLPAMLDVLSAYSSVLDRHESLASNLGARPLGPILMRRFEKCFDGPPEVITTHTHTHTRDHHDSTINVTWLEVVQFAQSHPGQFTLGTFSEGRRVCQFYYPQKQVRVQVSEEDYLFIKSGRCQDLIPTLPIWEDEEKEVGTCDILEKQLRELTNAADTVAARTRQLSHRLRGRRMAILERRAGEGNFVQSGNDSAYEQSQHDLSGAHVDDKATYSGSNGQGVHQSQANGTLDHATSHTPSSVQNELLQHFQSLSQSQNRTDANASTASAAPRRSSMGYAPPSVHPSNLPSHLEPVRSTYSPSAISTPNAPPAPSQRPDPLSYYLSDPNPPPPPVTTIRVNSSSNNHNTNASTPTSNNKHNFSRPLAPNQEISQPFRGICQAHMETLPRGGRVIPPCDRCRRLKMDCLKNLTSCQGCTKKHARCHWKDVERSEVEDLDVFSPSGGSGQRATHPSKNVSGASANGADDDDSEDEGMGALEDLEALGREEDRARAEAAAGKQIQGTASPRSELSKDNTPDRPVAHSTAERAPFAHMSGVESGVNQTSFRAAGPIDNTPRNVHLPSITTHSPTPVDTPDMATGINEVKAIPTPDKEASPPRQSFRPVFSPFIAVNTVKSGEHAPEQRVVSSTASTMTDTPSVNNKSASPAASDRPAASIKEDGKEGASTSNGHMDHAANGHSGTMNNDDARKVNGVADVGGQSTISTSSDERSTRIVDHGASTVVNPNDEPSLSGVVTAANVAGWRVH